MVIFFILHLPAYVFVRVGLRQNNSWSNMAPKFIVIGLDGADFSYIDPLIKEGMLPHIARLLKDGTSAKLRSTHVPFTATAWSTLLTGRNPGKTGT